MFSSCELGLIKADPEFFHRIRDRHFTDRKDALVLIDDDPRAIAAARSAGWTGLHFNPDLESSHAVEDLSRALPGL